MLTCIASHGKMGAMDTLGLTWHGYPVGANVSLLFPELPYRERFAAAAAAGFRSVESWWPFATAAPSPGELDALAGLIEDSGLSLTGMNVYAGDMAAGERGIAADPRRADELLASLSALRRIAGRTGCRAFNLLHGAVPRGHEAESRRTAVRSYRHAAAVMEDLEGGPGTILVEPLARGLNGAYPLETAADALALMDEIDTPQVALLLDTFHLARNDVDMIALIEADAERIGHVQLADAPDRGEPGSGTVDFDGIGSALRARSYSGTVAAEYRPTRETRSTLTWLRAPEAEGPLA